LPVYAALRTLGRSGVAELVERGCAMARRFADQLGDTLQMLASGLRAGYGLGQCVDIVAKEAEEPTAEEFRRLTVESRLGRELDDGLRALAGRMQSVDLGWVVQAVEIHRQVGGDLAGVLDTVGNTIRDRNRVRRQVQAASAEGRLSAGVLFALPFGVGAITAVIHPDYMSVLTSSGIGLGMLVSGAVLMAVGGLWLRRIVRPEF
jgi:tight adherence protein B